ncbi:MAG: DNA topoisomerase subunit B [Clostridia bacterium]|nr:DNA topoisomerase subunit B [Clostridia bacterium]
MAEYKAKDIQVLGGLDAVRMRPGMYIGTTSSRGLHHLLWEIVDNAVDEGSNGYATRIEITLNEDNSVTVEDNGRGIPVDIHPDLKVSAVEVVYTQLHAGGKFNTNNYAYSGGLHGVGASVTNALSEFLEVEVYKNGYVYYQKFTSHPDSNNPSKIISGDPVEPLKKMGKTDKNGTRVTFLPDTRVFGSVAMNYEVVNKRINELAFLNNGLEFILNDKRQSDDLSQSLKKIYKYDGGIADFVKDINQNKIPLHLKVLFGEGQNEVMKLSFALQYTNSYSETVVSYVNNIPTPEGGMHETGVKNAITKVFNAYARKRGLLKDKDDNLLGEDYREGISCIISVRMSNVQFEGQTKTKLGNAEARPAAEQIVTDLLTDMLEKEKDIGDIIIKKSIASANAREASRKAKELTRAKNTILNSNLVGKLASCTGKDYSKNELFIVEGDSAGGSAKQARDKKYQAILPLRGKPLNVERSRLDKVLENEEFRSIITALDTSIGDDFDLQSLKYDKIIILSDADQDGAHIRAILLTFFFRYMKELLMNGHVYIGMPPLYKVSKKDKVMYAYDDRELTNVMNEIGRSPELQRYKGLGEMNATQLWDTTMNPESRVLMRVTIDDAAEAEKMVTMLMGDKVDARRSFIIEHADFNKDKDETFESYV